MSVETILRLTPAVLGSTVFSIVGLCAAHACLDDLALLAAREAIGSSLQTLGSVYAVLLAGIVAEGLAPYATLSASQDQALLRAVHRGVPVLKTARGNASGLVPVRPENLFIEGNNLTATKARLLLTAAIMKLGALPPVADPERPTREELDAIRKRIAAYQEIFQTHRTAYAQPP